MQQIVKVDAAQFGIEESKAAEVAAQFKPMLDKMVELEKEFNEIIALPITQETCGKAKALRLKYVKVRSGTAEIHKQQKAFYLAAGRFIDGWKNAQLFASEGIEKKLSDIENHFENLERERIEALKKERNAVLIQYVENPEMYNAHMMDDEAFTNLVNGLKLAKEQREQAEREAEKARIEKERQEAEERERIRIENERLKAEAEAREREIAAERAKAEVERKALEEQQRKEREAAEKAAREEREKLEAENRRIQQELEAKQKAEAEARKRAEEEEQAKLNMGDADKVKALIDDLNALKTKYTFKSKKNIELYASVSVLIDKIVAHIQK